ncbi:MAG: toprim domain-containing protein [Acidimicrobiales bacterium]
MTFPEPQFKGQTKQELGTPAIRSIVYESFKVGFTDWSNGGGKKTQINALREKMTNAVLNRVMSKQALEARRKQANLGSTGLPDKLADCRSHGADAELLIVEGNSAAGPAKAGRDAETMAVLPLRGKVVNAGKASLKQVVENTEAQALITAIGAGSGRDFDLASSRYGRIIILCDADVDGSHIRCLLLTLIYHHMRPLLGGPRPCGSTAALRHEVSRHPYYAYTDDERTALSTEHGITLDKWKRFKGLGEMNVEELAETTLNPATRTLKRMTMDDGAQASEAAELFEILMGSDVANRKDYIIENSGLIDPELLDI